jgi:hypothetical protein
MANRIRPLDEKVQSVKTALEQINIEKAAHTAGVPASTLRYDLQKVAAALPDVLANRKPGPKPSTPVTPVQIRTDPSEAPKVCPACGGKVRKNGTYWVLNWLLMLTLGWLGKRKVLIQRRRCKTCGCEIPAPERVQQAEARRAWWQQVNRVIAFCRFKLRLSVRYTQLLVAFLYVRQVSLGHIERLTLQVGRCAKAGLDRLSQCRQAVAQCLLFDETFPKLKKRAYSLGVAMCEHGLIRSVRCILRKGRDIPAQLRRVVGAHFQPTYFLTDLEVHYPQFLHDAGLSMMHLRERIHLVRQIVRLFNEAVRDVSLRVPKGLPTTQRKKQLALKRRLLRKRLLPLLALVFKAFSPGYESVCVLMLEGLLSQLQDPAVILQTASVQVLVRRLRRFLNKYGASINVLLQLSVEQGIPTTTNSLENKNSLFKALSRIAKFFPAVARCELFFCAVALLENFEVKTRGPSRGTSAMQRAGINLEDFGAVDFFSAVGLPKPQISLAYVTE